MRTDVEGVVAPFVLKQVRALRRYVPLVFTFQNRLEPVGLAAYGGLVICAPYSRRLIGRTLQRLTRRLWGSPLDFSRAILRHRPRILHAHFGTVAVDFLAVARRHNIPLVTSFYGYDISSMARVPWYRHKLEQLLGGGAAFLVEGTHAKATVEELGAPPDRVVVHRLGVDVRLFPMMARSADSGDEVRVLVCNALVEKKGTADALEAFSRVRADHPGMRLTIVGDGPLRPRVEDQICQLGLEGGVRLMGRLDYDEYRELLYEHHILLAPSFSAADGRTEGGAPVVLLEAQASGMPVLSTNHADIPNVVLDSRSGFIVPERDVGAMAERLNYLVCHPEVWRSMGLQGRRFILAKHNLRVQTAHLEDMYDSLDTARAPRA